MKLLRCLPFLLLVPSLRAAPVVAIESDGIIRGEAEDFARQENSDVRVWHIITTSAEPGITPDADPSHVDTASGGAYIEILPDTRATHADKLIHGENFSPEPGKMAVLSYPIRITTPGRYYVWLRIFSTGPEDNGVHVGLNGTWPESGRRWQTVKKRAWQWDCKQRTAEVHVGVPMQLWLDIPTAGDHTLQLSMREDGFELDQWLLARDIAFRPEPALPAPSPASAPAAAPATVASVSAALEAKDFPLAGTHYYLDQGKWAAIHPERHQTATVSTSVPVGNARFDIALHAVGESDGRCTYEVLIGGRSIGTYQVPLSTAMFEEGPKFVKTWPDVAISEGETVEVRAAFHSADGKEYARARWSRLVFTPTGLATASASVSAAIAPAAPSATITPTVSGELRQWHAVTLDLAGPTADEQDLKPNPFTDYALNVTFTHESGAPSYVVSGYFAADGNAAETGATAGNVWRAHLSPDQAGRWDYTISFHAGPNAATYRGGLPLAPYHGAKGSFTIAPTDKTTPDFRARGRLAYTGERYLRFAGDGTSYLKAGPDAPETMLAYAGFDNTTALKANVPLKTWAPHLGDWRPGDPTWHGGKGKGLIGALNYLSTKGVNAFSFLTYNTGGDGDNIWPFVERDDKLHYDVSKLAQWEIVFAHAQRLGLYLHFKLQENELDDHRATARRDPKIIPEAMDAGETGPERRLYFREMIARFGHHLALNWNFGEENTQTYDEQVAMFNYVAAVDPYGHHRVIHTFPNQQDSIYTSLLGDRSNLTGASAQNHWSQAHARTLQWIEASAAAGRPWVVANDEQNPAGMGVPPDPGYQGFDGVATSDNGTVKYDLHDIRQYTLWGNLMAGGAGVEYYFGYQLPQNDLLAEDFRSRDRSWDYCRLALEFFHGLNFDLNRLQSSNTLVGNQPGQNGNWCLAAPGELYVIYLPAGGPVTLDLTAATGSFAVTWHNPREPAPPRPAPSVSGGKLVSLGSAPTDPEADWALLVRRAP